MNIEEAFQKLKRLELQDFGKKRKFELKESEVAYITVSNELDKYRDRIYELINEVTIKDAEIEKKDKVIDMMAECIDGEPTFGYGHLRDINTPEKVKEYFYKKIEKIN